MSILREILRHKRKEVANSKKCTPLEIMRRAALALPKKKFSFSRALRAGRPLAVIAEIKRKSPSRGMLCEDFDAVRIAKQYEKAGASALSVLTDEKYFGGSDAFIAQIKKAVKIPVLRKEFIVDEYQVYESRLLGADAVLFIAAALTPDHMKRFYEAANLLGLDALFEVHTEAELKKTLPLKPAIVGVNNRDLRTFKVDLRISWKLSDRIEHGMLFISESGIRTGQDLRYVRSIGARAALVGETLMSEKSPGEALERLLADYHGSR